MAANRRVIYLQLLTGLKKDKPRKANADPRVSVEWCVKHWQEAMMWQFRCDPDETLAMLEVMLVTGRTRGQKAKIKRGGLQKEVSKRQLKEEEKVALKRVQEHLIKERTVPGVVRRLRRRPSRRCIVAIGDDIHLASPVTRSSDRHPARSARCAFGQLPTKKARVRAVAARVADLWDLVAMTFEWPNEGLPAATIPSC